MANVQFHLPARFSAQVRWNDGLPAKPHIAKPALNPLGLKEPLDFV
jgi:hypothetical protein